jgi:hypothetical protein
VINRKRLWALGAATALATAAMLAVPAQAHAPVSQTATSSAGTATDQGVAPYTGLTSAQRAQLMSIAKDTWKFFGDDVDAQTHLPLDNLTYAGGSATPTDHGRYTSSANIGVYLWSLVSASDLGLISRDEATADA